jgi:hypothetical protein
MDRPLIGARPVKTWKLEELEWYIEKFPNCDRRLYNIRNLLDFSKKEVVFTPQQNAKIIRNKILDNLRKARAARAAMYKARNNK